LPALFELTLKVLYSIRRVDVGPGADVLEDRFGKHLEVKLADEIGLGLAGEEPPELAACRELVPRDHAPTRTHVCHLHRDAARRGFPLQPLAAQKACHRLTADGTTRWRRAAGVAASDRRDLPSKPALRDRLARYHGDGVRWDVGSGRLPSAADRAGVSILVATPDGEDQDAQAGG
jgi:hypothetical protein